MQQKGRGRLGLRLASLVKAAFAIDVLSDFTLLVFGQRLQPSQEAEEVG